MLEAQRRFLAGSLAACEADPAAHPHQLLALGRELALAAESADVQAYLAASGNVLELARAETLDGAWNRLRVAQAVQDRWLERAAAEAYVHGVLHWPAGAPPATAPPAGGLFARALLLELEVRIGGRADAGEHLAGARAALHAADPGFDPAAPEYAARVPWRELPPWLDAGPGGEDAPPPDVRGALEAWRERLRAPALPVPPVDLDGPPPPDPAELARAAAAPLRARCEAALERQAAWPDPLVARHHRSLIDALDAARTRTEVALAAAFADACVAVEADWNALLHAALVAPLRARCGGADPARAGELAVVLLGADPLRLARTETVLEAAARVAREPEVTLGAEAGEAGFDLLADLRAHLAAGGAVPVLPDAREDFPIDLPNRPVLRSEPRL